MRLRPLGLAVLTDFRPFRRDSDKAEAQGWGAEEGKQELEAEVLGEADAQADGAATPAPATGTQTPARIEEEEDNTQTYEEYLAAQAEKKLKLSLPEARVANDGDDNFKGTKLVKKEEQQYDEFLGETKEKKQVNKERKAKQLIEHSFSSKPTPGSEGPSARGGRGGRGGPRGGRGGRGEGRGGARGGRGQGPRGGNGNNNNKSSAPAVNLADNTAFPSL